MRERGGGLEEVDLIMGKPMKRDWEVFKRDVAKRASEPMVTLQKLGNISLNIVAFEALGEPDSVELLYDREECLMGIRAAVENCPHAYPVRKQSSGSGFVVSGRAFTQHYNIMTDVGRRFRAILDDGILAVDLKDSDAMSDAIAECRRARKR
jgi:hypothetical protein